MSSIIRIIQIFGKIPLKKFNNYQNPNFSSLEVFVLNNFLTNIEHVLKLL